MPGNVTPPVPPTLVPTFSHFILPTHRQIETLIRCMRPSTCSLDPLPTALIKSNITSLSPLITTIINSSLQSGHLPTSLKTALINPRLKKPSLDPDTMSNYRPISNLPFLSKVIEKVIVTQIHNHLHSHSLYEKFQSGFRSGHSTETALVRVTNDLLVAADQGSPSLLLLLDLSAAFDTVDHTILLHRLQHFIGISHTALQWFRSYLTDRVEYVVLGGARSRPHTVTCGVPQGSVLGPTLFSIYMLPLGHIISRHGVAFHCYADDTQLYVRLDPTSPTSSLPTLTACLEETKAWMTDNFLQLNS
uniref:Reverse transcriptase domain-containing protein n=1 Tax=Neogobius melanostomus TaxID=47308 RepID=A0A8C6UE42_9GOBI